MKNQGMILVSELPRSTALSLVYCMGEELTLHAEQAIAAEAKAHEELHQNEK